MTKTIPNEFNNNTFIHLISDRGRFSTPPIKNPFHRLRVSVYDFPGVYIHARSDALFGKPSTSSHQGVKNTHNHRKQMILAEVQHRHLRQSAPERTISVATQQKTICQPGLRTLQIQICLHWLEISETHFTEQKWFIYFPPGNLHQIVSGCKAVTKTPPKPCKSNVKQIYGPPQPEQKI